MGRDAKYIKLQDDSIIIVPWFVSHDAFASMNPKGAGFVQFEVWDDAGSNVIKATCYGRSDSLKLDSDPVIDAKIIDNQILGIRLV